MNSSEFTSAQQHSAVYAPFPRYYHLFMNDHVTANDLQQCFS